MDLNPQDLFTFLYFADHRFDLEIKKPTIKCIQETTTSYLQNNQSISYFSNGCFGPLQPHIQRSPSCSLVILASSSGPVPKKKSGTRRKSIVSTRHIYRTEETKQTVQA
ncbi:hypothetical protein AVEN_203167-1 [Araneus ventricosus]|uniref:Uncharacterized protein n=1 Tax=Araneus ventricosus TaxID=182803 RepID=A0A4Y2CGV6_ARAVE|nr:hypothetical protein AVEN_203167-1 [Araneus ventricosus]